jgi:hypothetical protein
MRERTCQPDSVAREAGLLPSLSGSTPTLLPTDRKKHVTDKKRRQKNTPKLKQTPKQKIGIKTNENR